MLFFSIVLCGLSEILPAHITWVEAYFKCDAVANLCALLRDSDRYCHNQGSSPAAAVSIQPVVCLRISVWW